MDDGGYLEKIKREQNLGMDVRRLFEDNRRKVMNEIIYVKL